MFEDAIAKNSIIYGFGDKAKVTTTTADESVIYQSLHSTYLSIMRILYFDIAQNNETGEEKLYTNAIDLFNIWRDKAILQRNDGIERQRGTVEKGNALKIK